MALSLLAACGGRAANSQSEDGGAFNGGGGVSGSAGASFFTPQGGAAPCCNVVVTCDAGDEALVDRAECLPGASCYSITGCCQSVTWCAYVPPPTVSPGIPADAGTCSLLGTWDTRSAPWNGERNGTEITFKSDGELVGSNYFAGSWSLSGSSLTIENTTGLDMTCAFADHWTLTFSEDCQTASLVTIDSACAGERRYLDGNVTLTPTVVK